MPVRKQSLTRRTWSELAVLATGCLLFVGLIIHLWRSSGPLWSANADPGYQYLLNGGNLVSRDPPGHFDHPGTSLQWVSGVISHVVARVGGDGSVRESLATFPEVHARALVSVLIATYGLVIFALVATMRRYLGFPASLAALLVIASGAVVTVPWVFLVQPEAIVAICSTLSIALLVIYESRGRAPHALAAVALGALVAGGMTAKIVMLPMVAVILIILRMRDRFIFLGTSIGMALLIMRPLWARSNEVISWFVSTANNPGRTGDTGRSWAVGPNLWTGVSQLGIYLVVLLFVVLLAAAVLANQSRKHGLRFVLRWPFAMLAGIVLTLLIAYKPSTIRDFTVLVPLSAALAAWALAGIARPKSQLALIMLGLFALASLFQASRVSLDRGSRSFSDAQDVAAVLERLDGKVALAYGAWTEGAALRFGNEWSFSRYSTAIKALYPNELEYSLWHRKFYHLTERGREVLGCDDLAQFVRRDGLSLVIPRAFAENQNLLTLDGDEMVLEDLSRLSFKIAPADGNFNLFLFTDVTCSR